MFKRYRWYRIQLPKNSISLPEAITKNPLKADNDFGFSVIEHGADSSVFRFLWRTKITVTKFDESGDLTFENLSTVSFTDFTVINIDEEIFLRVENPARTLKDLFNTLESIYGLGFTNKRVTFEKNKPKRIFESINTVTLVKLKIIGAVFEDGLVGRLELESKKGILLDQMKILQNVQHKIDSASYELVYEGVHGQLTFSANGSVKVGGALTSRILHLIEMDLLSFI
jgi:hypothetical protein